MSYRYRSQGLVIYFHVFTTLVRCTAMVAICRADGAFFVNELFVMSLNWIPI